MKMKKNRKLKGSVLLTVVFVMAILIVFLFGTMSLAIAASNRSHVNYSSAQTSVTARTVAESAIMALANSSDEGTEYAKAVCALEKGMSQTVNVRISQGGSDVSGIGDISQVTIEHVGSTQFFDQVSNKWEPRDVLKFTANVEMGGVMSTSSVYVVKHLEQDKITAAGGGAGFVTTAGADLKTQTSIYGGAYISLPRMEKAQEYKYVDDYVERMKNRTFTVDNGDWAEIEKDFHLQNSAAVIEADLFVNNNMYLENWSGIVFPGKKKGVTVLGDLTFSENSRDHFHYYMAPENKFTANADNTVDFVEMPYVYVDGVISGKTIKLGNGGTNGGPGPNGGPGNRPQINTDTQDFPLNTFCGSISTLINDRGGNVNTVAFENNNNNKIANGNANGIVINSNLYCMDAGATSYIVSQNRSDLVRFADSTFNQTAPMRTEEISGEICSNGNLVLQNVTVNGDVRVAGTLTVYGEVTVNGNVVADKIDKKDQAQLICHNGAIYRNDEAEGGVVETIKLTIPNKVGYFYDYKLKPVTADDGTVEYRGIDGEPLNDSYFENGKLREDKEAPSTIYYTMLEGYDPFMVVADDPNVLDSNEAGEFIEDTHYFYEGSGDYAKFALPNNIVKDRLINELGYILDEFAVANGFYYETKKDLLNFKRATPELPDGYEKAKDASGNEYMFQRDVDYSHKIERTNPNAEVEGKITNNVNDTSVYLEAKGETTIYPKYALRRSVLGLNGNDDTKIVKTIEEILTEVDPYNPSDMPSDLSDAGYAAKNLPTYSSISEAANDMGLLVAEGSLPNGYVKNDANKYDLNGATFYKVIKADYDKINENAWGSLVGDTGSENVANLITKDCILNFEGYKKAYFDPADKSITVGIKDAGFPSGAKIYVNDASGGKVYFYIESGGNFNLKGCTLLTDSYWKFLTGKTAVSFASTIDHADKIEDMGDKMKPNVFVFGADGSNMDIENMNVISAYIKSPNIETKIGGTVPFGDLKEFYYHNYDIFNHAKPTIIGCFNVQEVTSGNMLNTVYIPQDQKNDEDIIIQVGQHWYVPYYYSEF